MEPVIVREFRDIAGDNDYTKSERIMGRCSMALFDLSFLQGQMMELPMAGLAYKIPFFAGFINGTVSGELHGTGMVRGFLASVGVEPEAVVNTVQLENQPAHGCPNRSSDNPPIATNPSPASPVSAL